MEQNPSLFYQEEAKIIHICLKFSWVSCLFSDFFFSLARYLCLLVEVPSKHKTFVYGATQPRNKCSYMKLGKSSKESRFSCWRVERNQISGNHKSPGSFHPGLKWSFLTPVNLCSICFQDSSEFHQTLLCPLFSGTAFTARHPHPIPHAHTHTTPTHVVCLSLAVFSLGGCMGRFLSGVSARKR